MDVRRRMARAVLFGGILLALCARSRAETVRFPAIADVGVSSLVTSASMGRLPQLRLKNIQEMILLNFDLRALRGKRIRAVRLRMRTVPETARQEMQRLRIPESFVDPLRHIGVSTVSSPWVEGEQDRSFQPDPRGRGATFDEASFNREPWAWAGSKLTDVVFGMGQSVHCHAALVREHDMWWSVAVEPAVIETLVAGGGHGIAVMDETGLGGELGANTTVFARETTLWTPSLEIEIEGDAPGPMPAPTGFSVASALEKASLARGAVRVQLRVPEGAAAYRVQLDGRRLEPWQVARPGKAGDVQSFYLTDLLPAADYKIEVEALDGAGNVSPRVTAQVKASSALARPPELSVAGFWPREGEPPVGGAMCVWAFPELAKADPLTGELLHEAGGARFRKANAVWDGARRLVRLVAARGEIVGYQIAIERTGASIAGVRVEPGVLAGSRGTIGADRMRLWRAWYVQAGGRWHAELALPHDKPFDVPAADNGVVGQRCQAVWVDIAIPKDAPPGRYQGWVDITASSGGAPVRLKVELEVLDVTIPDDLNFVPELNSYAPPGEPGSEAFFEAHRLAHYHRCTLITVPYSQYGNMHEGLAPTLAGEGAGVKVSGLTDFDRSLGPLLDGSAFVGNPRAGVPVKSIYLPLHENWPLPVAHHYAYRGKPGKDSMVLHRLTTPPIAEAFDAAYKAGWMNVAREFAAHFEAKGWNRTQAYCFLNNKWTFGGTSWWLLDEPWGRDDFLALRFFAAMWREATRNAAPGRMLFRADISRPQWQADTLDGLIDIEYVNSGIFQRERTDQLLAERTGAAWMAYGACSDVGASHLDTALWCLRAFVEGCRGVTPWDSLDLQGASFRKPNPTGLIVDGRSLGYGAVASFRVFALRRGAQDAELLRLLAQKHNLALDQIGALVSKRVPLGGRFEQRALTGPASARSGNPTTRGFAELAEGAMRLIASRNAIQ